GLEFAVSSAQKAVVMPFASAYIAICARGRRCAVALLFGSVLLVAPAAAQPMFAQPESLPPSGALTLPGASLVSPNTRAFAPPALRPTAPAPGTRGSPLGMVPPALGGLAVAARFADGKPIKAKLHWRVYADNPDATGAFRMIKEEAASAPTFVLPP